MKTVLIVDADGAAEGLGSVLRLHGHSVVGACDVQAALRLLRSDLAVDLVVTEIAFSSGTTDGLQFLDELKRLVPGVPVIVVTGQGSIESYLHAVSRGVVEYLNKPVMAKEFSRIVRLALAGEPPRLPDAA